MNPLLNEAEMELLLRTAFNSTSLKVLSHKRIDKGLGFTSFIYRTEFSSKEHLPKSVLVKIPTDAKFNGSDEPEAKTPIFDIDIQVLYDLHNKEAEFYEMVARLDTSKALKIPKIYGKLNAVKGSSSTPFIILEDLSVEGRVPDMMLESLSLPQIRQMIDFLASIHAFSLINPQWNESGTYQAQNKETAQMLMSIAKSAASTLVTAYPTAFTLTDNQLERLFDFDTYLKALDPGNSPKVIVHGDLWSSNIIYKKNGEILDEELLGVVDWQTPYPGHCGTDLARLMTSSVDFNLRRQYEAQLIQEYYELLKGKLPKGYQLHLSLEDVIGLYRKALTYASVSFFLNVPFSFVAAPWGHETRVEFVHRVVANVQDALAV